MEAQQDEADKPISSAVCSLRFVSREMRTTLLSCTIASALLGAGCDNSEPSKLPEAMSEAATWDDTSREDLRDTLRNLVLGEVRLGNSSHDDIVEICRDVYIVDECPENEWEKFVQFARDELKKAESTHSKEQAGWPAETDCDRLDRVEAALRDRGILLWQVSPCCDTCTGGELPDRIDEIESRHPGFRDKVRGYAFFIDQNMADMLAEDTKISVYLAYGWFSPDDSKVEPDVYEKNALGIAREVCDCLCEHGFELDWDGSFSKKIGISLKWQRRTMLQYQ